MKKFFALVFAGALLFTFINCGGGDSDDPKVVMGEVMDILEDGVGDLEGADTVDDAIAIFEKYGAKIKDMEPRIKAAMEKNPELKNMDPMKGNVPEEFKDIGERMKGMMPKIMAMAMKMQEWGKDPKFQEALKKLGESLNFMDK
jgi:hypothetical protein